MRQALVLLLTIGLLFGCGRRETTPSGDIATGDVRDSSTRAAEGEIFRESTLSAPGATESLDIWVVGPLPAGANPWRDQNIFGTLLFPRTIRRNPETLQWEPWLADSWRIDDEGRYAEVTLREGYSWSDGSPMTSADWVAPANRYFTDPGARSPYTRATTYSGLDPRWTILGERSFRVEVAHPTDRATLLSLLFLPPLPPDWASIDEPNGLWRFPPSTEAAGRQPFQAPVSGAPYSVASISREGETLLVRLNRRETYVDPAYGDAGAREVAVRFLSPETYLAESQRDDAPQAHLIYLGPEAEELATDVPEGYRTLSAGSDLTPAILIFGRDSAEQEELRAAARSSRDSFVESADRVPIFARSYPSLGLSGGGPQATPGAARNEGLATPLGPPLFGPSATPDLAEVPAEAPAGSPELRPGDTPADGSADTPTDSPAAGTDAASDQPPIDVLVQAGEEHRRYAELLVDAARQRGLRLEPTYLDRESLAARLLTPGEWTAAIVEFREGPEPTLGDPLFGNLLPLSHRWELLVSRRLPRTATVPPLTPGELADLDSVASAPGGWEQLLTRLWKTVATGDREAERRLAQSALEELWRQREPWVYLYDEEQLHFFRPGLGNLLFRHIPGADLGTVLPLLYLEREER